MIKPKKYLGQHFLTNQQIANDIVNLLEKRNNFQKVLEIGPGTGVLTDLLVKRYPKDLYVIDLDKEAIIFLKKKYISLYEYKRIIEGDFLEMNLDSYFPENFAVIGNFPYNISSQILFRVFEYHHKIPQVVGMFQKEVAQRIAAGPGSKDYGILSVLLQAYYNIGYHFTVDEHEFHPPPQVKSGVIRLERNEVSKLDCSESLFVKVVKTAFGQRRKTLRNALKPLLNNTTENKVLDQRAEQLSVKEFIALTQYIEMQRESA